jgi:2-polyprenyl-6-methoxyphenol hydroxylase-like FAD-dependent oxidoreductase
MDVKRKSSEPDTPVLIVGGGPVGLALAIELGIRGVACTVLDEREGVVRNPKASLISTRTMEFCRRWGIVDKLFEASLPPDWPMDVLFVTSMSGRELHRFTFPSYAEKRRFDYSPERYIVCAQIFFDPILLERARAIPGVTILHRTRFDSFTQDESGIRAEFTDLPSGHQRTLSARYLIGCDGGESRVRALAGITIPRTPALNHNMNIFFSAPDLLSRHPGQPGLLYRLTSAHGSWGNVTPIAREGLWRLTVYVRSADGTLASAPPDPATFDVDGYIRRAIGPDVAYEVISATPWERRETVADQYRIGRVFLAGDSAHQLSTTGGFGMNTGIGDAVDLGWMLAAEIAQWAGPDLLDAYEAERRQIGTRNVDEASGNFKRIGVLASGAAIDDDTREGDALRAAFVEDIHQLGVKQQFEVEGVTVGYSYAGSPVIVSDGTPAPPESPTRYTPSTRPGARAPHAWLSDGRSVLDLFGEGFTLLRFAAEVEPGTALIDVARERGVPLNVVDIADIAIARLYERRLVLVRPDGHVAWRGDRCDNGDVIDVVRGAGTHAAARSSEEVGFATR